MSSGSKAPEMIASVPEAAQAATSQAAVTAPLRTADMEPSSVASQLPAVAAVETAPAASSAALPSSVSAAPAALPASTAASVHVSGATSAASPVTSAAAAVAAAASDAQNPLSRVRHPKLLSSNVPAWQQLRTQAAEVSANPPEASIQPPTGPPSQSAQDPSPSPGQTPAGTPQSLLAPKSTAVPAVEPETIQSAALPSVYANLPGKATLSKSKSMQPRSVAMGASKIPLKVIRPQIPGMTKAPSPSIAGASMLIGEARRHLEANMASASQLGPTAKCAQHSMPADSLPPCSAGSAAAKPAGTASGPNDAVLGQNSTNLAMQVDEAPSAAHVMCGSITHPTPPIATLGQPREGPTPPAAGDRLRREASTLSEGRPDGTGAAAMGSSLTSIGRADGNTARPVGSIDRNRESPKGQEAMLEKGQSQAAEATRGRQEVYNRARDRCEYLGLFPSPQSTPPFCNFSWSAVLQGPRTS